MDKKKGVNTIGKILEKFFDKLEVLYYNTVMEKTKRCYVCDKHKVITDFYTDGSKGDGRSSKCKVCSNIRAGIRRRKKKYSNVSFKLRCKMVELLKRHHSFKGFKREKSNLEILGLSWEKLKEYLESNFKEGMSWENYGKWHIDHVIPYSFALNVDELYNLNYYINLQPLWSLENLKKGNKLLSTVNIPKVYTSMKYMIHERGMYRIVEIYLKEKYDNIISCQILVDDSVFKIELSCSSPTDVESIQNDLRENLSLNEVCVSYCVIDPTPN